MEKRLKSGKHFDRSIGCAQCRSATNGVNIEERASFHFPFLPLFLGLIGCIRSCSHNAHLENELLLLQTNKQDLLPPPGKMDEKMFLAAINAGTTTTSTSSATALPEAVISNRFMMSRCEK